MTKLFKGGQVVNVFTCEIEKTNILERDGRIIGVGDYEDADEIIDVTGKYLCPGFIDGHIHIESTMLMPAQFAKAVVPHGTSAVIADPHEIVNVCGKEGLSYMLEASKNLPMDVFIAIPSCVPATPFDENGAPLKADDIAPFYDNKKVVSLGEVMNFPGVISEDPGLMKMIDDAISSNRVVNGHAPLLTGKELDKYISNGVGDDHECSGYEEARERIAKGQHVLIRNGTAAKNLKGLIGLFDEPYCYRCLLVADDKHPSDIISDGHIDSIIRLAAKLGKPVVRAIRMATIQAAEYYGLKYTGALAPGYAADILVLDDLEAVDVRDVYHKGVLVCENKKCMDFVEPHISSDMRQRVYNTIHMDELTADDFYVEPFEGMAHVIKVNPGQLLTDDVKMSLDFNTNNGIDTSRDILKIAVCERHHNTGHIGLSYITGMGLKRGAICSTVSHDSHNMIIVGTSDEQMAIAARECKKMGGGLVAVEDGNVIAALELKVAGLMSDKDARSVARDNEAVRQAAHSLGAPDDIEPFMLMAFVSLTVIPHLKITTLGLVDVDKQELISNRC